MKKSTFLLILILPLISIAQKQGNIWYFGDHAGLDFNTGAPIVLTDGQTYSPDGSPIECSAVISDSSGSLLFYTNGMKIWNKNQQVMPNGDSILGSFSSTFGALIVAQPGSSRYFYVFTTDAFYNDNLIYGFRYSIVDICLDSGLGDVIKEKKNIKLLDTVAEKLTAVRHTNGIDYWIITHKYYSDAFYSYHLSSAGIIDTVISHVGSVHPIGMIGTVAAIGELKASPNGQRLAIVNGQDGTNNNIAEYFDFDKNTGIVSNCISIQTNPLYSYYGISFSPDNTKLYISCWLNNIGIYQFDLNAGGGNPDSVRASMTQLSNPFSVCYGMQLAVDGKIYLARSSNPGSYLSVINNPNNAGLNCNFVDAAIYLNSGLCSAGLPNFIDSYDYSNTTYNCDTVSVIEISFLNPDITIFPNPSNGSFQIENTQSKVETIEIFNAFGALVYEKTVNSNQISMNLNVPDGIYFIYIIYKEGITTKKIIIQR